MAAQAARRRGAAGRHEALLLPHPPVRGASSGPPGRGRVRPGPGPRHELRRPRGRARPARAELPLRPPGQRRRTTSRRTGRSARPSGASTTCCPRSCPSPSRACRPTAITTTSRSATTTATTSSTTRTGPRSSPASPQLPRRPARPLPRAHVRRQPDGELVLPHVGHRLLGADLQELGLAEPHHHRARRERRALRVPRGGLLQQPVPDGRGAAASGAGRHPQRERPGRPAERQHLRAARGGRGHREGAGLARRRARGARRRRGRAERDARPALQGVRPLQARRVGALPGGRHRLGARRVPGGPARRCVASPDSSTRTARRPSATTCPACSSR